MKKKPDIVLMIWGKIKSIISRFSDQDIKLKDSVKNNFLLYFIFLFTITFSFFLKYPYNGLEGGVDSNIYHQLANIVISKGYIPWSKSPLSLFGLYPVSDNTGMIVLISSLSETVDLDLIYCLTPFTLIQSIIVVPAVFMAAYEFKRDVYFSSISTIVYSLTTRYIFYTNYVFNSRGFFLTLAPFFFWALLRYYRNRNIKILALLIVFSIICLSIHLMSLIFLFFIFIFAVAPYIHKNIFPYIFSHLKIFLSMVISIFIVSIVLIYASSLIYIKPLGGILSSTPKKLLVGPKIVSYFIAFGYNITIWLGLLSVLTIFGFILILINKRRNVNETSVLLSIFIILPLTGGALYIAPPLLFFSSLLIAYPIFYYKDCLKERKEKIFVVAISIIIVSASIIFNLLIYDIGMRKNRSDLKEDLEPKYWMDTQIYQTGIYMRYRGHDFNALGDWIYSRRVGAVANEPYGKVFERGFGHIDHFDYDSVELKGIKSMINNPTEPFSIEPWYWDEYPNYYAGIIDREIMDYPVNHSKVKEWSSVSGLRYIIGNEKIQRRHRNREYRYEYPYNTLYVSPEYFRYKIYRNDKLCVYVI